MIHITGPNRCFTLSASANNTLWSCNTTLNSVVYSTKSIPTQLIGFNEARAAYNRSEKKQTSSEAIHFYINDSLFNCVWNQPEKYIHILKQYGSIIGPDFSQYTNMTLDERLFNNFRNKTLSLYWQQHGLNVIPNVSWSLPDSYDDCFSWIPKHSVIAINCTGIKKHDCSKFLWLKGYHEALKRLEPLQIIRYGEKMPEESEEISIYFPNEQLFKLKHIHRQHSKKRKNIVTNQLKFFETWEETEVSSAERHFPQKTENMKRCL